MLEIFARDVRVLRTQVSRRDASVDTPNVDPPTNLPVDASTVPPSAPTPIEPEDAPQDAPAFYQPFSDSAETGVSGDPDMGEALHDEDVTIVDAVTEEDENFSREAVVSSVAKETGGDRTQALQDEDSFAHLLFADDDIEGWTALASPEGDTEAEGLVLPTLVQNASVSSRT